MNNAAKGIVALIVVALSVMFAVYLEGNPVPKQPSASSSTQSGATTLNQRLPLISVLPKCNPTGRISCDDDLFKRVWYEIKGGNGERMRIDLNSIKQAGSSQVIVYLFNPATHNFDPSGLRRLTFDCNGHYMDTTGDFSPWFDAPPNSLVGVAAHLACRCIFELGRNSFTSRCDHSDGVSSSSQRRNYR